MGEIKIFRMRGDEVEEIYGHFVHLERELQNLFERNMKKLLGVHLLAHEYHTGKTHPGQIDSLGIDENYCPVIIEYKRRNDDNIITQALYYLDWLMGHQAEFALLARAMPGFNPEREIEFSASRVICIASAYNRYDERAARQIDRNIELIRYRFYSEDFFLLERVYASAPYPLLQNTSSLSRDANDAAMPLPMQNRIRHMNDGTEDIYLQLLSFAENLGEDVVVRFLKHYVAFVRMKNFLSIQPNKSFLKVWLHINPDEYDLSDGFFRDVRKIGHHSSGSLEADVYTEEDLAKVKPLIEEAYRIN